MFKQLLKFEYCLGEEAISFRKQAEGMPHSARRDELLRKASQIDILNKWLTSPGLQEPKLMGEYHPPAQKS
jgi:hypothetical protein